MSEIPSTEIVDALRAQVSQLTADLEVAVGALRVITSSQNRSARGYRTWAKDRARAALTALLGET